MSEGMVTREQVKDFIKAMSLMEAATLVKELEEELGVSAAAPMMAAGRPWRRPRRRRPRRRRTSTSC